MALSHEGSTFGESRGHTVKEGCIQEGLNFLLVLLAGCESLRGPAGGTGVQRAQGEAPAGSGRRQRACAQGLEAGNWEDRVRKARGSEDGDFRLMRFWGQGGGEREIEASGCEMFHFSGRSGEGICRKR